MYKKLALGIMTILLAMLLVAPAAAVKPPEDPACDTLVYTCGDSLGDCVSSCQPSGCNKECMLVCKAECDFDCTSNGDCEAWQVCADGYCEDKEFACDIDLQVKSIPEWSVISSPVSFEFDASSFCFAGDVAPNTDYKIIYYPDPWPGNGLQVLGAFTSDADGSISGCGAFDFMDIPISSDTNSGAKIWLVLSSDVGASNMVAWNPTQYLFEERLIRTSVSLCGVPTCGDEICNGDEDVFSCSDDCGEPECGVDFCTADDEACDDGQCVDLTCSYGLVEKTMPTSGVVTDPWDVVVDGAKGTLMSNGDDLYKFTGEGLSADTEYMLVYYPDITANPAWPRTVAVIGTGTSDGDGDLVIDGTFNFDSIPGDLGQGADINAPNYKIWLVKSSDVSGGQVANWPLAQKFLFEEAISGVCGVIPCPAGYEMGNDGRCAEIPGYCTTDADCAPWQTCNDNSCTDKQFECSLVLQEKNPDGWTVISDKATMGFDGESFLLVGSGLQSETGYSLIYYPDPWPGTGMLVLGSTTSGPTGDIYTGGSFVFSQIPIPGDENDGAKIWLVKSSDIDGGQMIAWNPTQYLFEANLIQTDAGLCGGDVCSNVQCPAGQMCDAGSCIDDPNMMTISGYKYSDLNSNGKLDDGEFGVEGYYIAVYEVENSGWELAGDDVTDENGFYSITVPVIAVLPPEPGVRHYDIEETIQNDWEAVFPPETDDFGYAGYCLYGFTDDMTLNFFNHYTGDSCEDDEDCEEGYVCNQGQCVLDEPECRTDDDCDSGYQCVDGQCRDPPRGGGFHPYTESACQNVIDALRPMDDIDPSTLPVLDLHDTYVSAAFKYASQFDCVAIAYYTRGEPSFDKDCTAAEWWGREQTEVHAYGGMPILTAQNPAEAICFLAVKDSPFEKSLPVEISLTDSFGTKVAPIISSDPVIWKCYALNDEFDECRLRDSYDPFQTWRNPVVEEPEEEEEEEQTTCVGLDICDELPFEETGEDQS